MGVSGPQVVEGWYGQPFAKPLARTREVVDIIRQVLAREAPVTNDGPHYPLPYRGEGSVGLGKPLKPIVHPLRADIPIWLGAEGPKNVAQTAEIADGWIPIFYTPKSAGMYQPWLDEGFARPGRPAYPRRLRDRRDLPPPDHRRRRGEPASSTAMKPVDRALHGRHGRQGAELPQARLRADGVRRPHRPRCRSSSSPASKDEATALIPDELVDDMHIIGDAGEVQGARSRSGRRPA